MSPAHQDHVEVKSFTCLQIRNFAVSRQHQYLCFITLEDNGSPDLSFSLKLFPSCCFKRYETVWFPGSGWSESTARSELTNWSKRDSTTFQNSLHKSEEHLYFTADRHLSWSRDHVAGYLVLKLHHFCSRTVNYVTTLGADLFGVCVFSCDKKNDG